MRFNVPSKALYSATSGVSKVINSKNALTILNNFLFALDGNTLTITGSDVENALSASVEVTEAEGSGRVCIDARRMVDLLKEMPQQGLSIDVNESTLEVTISCADGRYSMVGTPATNIPNTRRRPMMQSLWNLLARRKRSLKASTTLSSQSAPMISILR